MKELQQLTKDQLYTQLKDHSEVFYSTVSSTLDFSFFGEYSSDEEDLSEFIEMLDKRKPQKK